MRNNKYIICDLDKEYSHKNEYPLLILKNSPKNLRNIKSIYGTLNTLHISQKTPESDIDLLCHA